MNSRFPSSLVLALLSLLSLPSFATTSRPVFEKAAEELIALIEKNDAATRSSADQWQTLQKHIRGAAAIAQSEQGFARSLEEIWTAWSGQGLRLLADTQAPYYAYKTEPNEFREAGVLFAQRGARWYVKQSTGLAPQKLHRGDAVMEEQFHPFKSLKQGSQNLRIQSQALKTAQSLSFHVRKTTLPQWALEATQKASTLIPWQGKNVCVEKGWVWLSPEVEAVLQSKITFAEKQCQALLIDLRDLSGPGTEKSLPAPLRKLPVAVLVNHETREGSVDLALQLKQTRNAEIFGEPTGSRQSPSAILPLREMNGILLLYPQNSGSLLPDQMVDDQWMFAEGFDGVKEKALQHLQSKLGST